MRKNGYTLPELLIVLGVVSLIAIVSIVKVSFAFSDIDNSEEIKKQDKMVIDKAAELYSGVINDRIKDEKVVYVSGTELIDAKYLADDEEFKTVKIKYTYDESNDKIGYVVE